jgi:uncharacterized membrane protein
MVERSGNWTDRRTELIIGILLRAGVLLAVAVVLAGEALYLADRGDQVPHYETFVGASPGLSTIPGVLDGLREFQPLTIVQFGLFLLVFTPVARVAFSVFAFAAERDWMYVAMTLLVLAVLIASVASGM